MGEEKKIVVNCNICDARKINEEELRKFNQIVIHANYVLVDKRSKEVLKHLPLECNMEGMLQLEEGEEVGAINYNGSYEITGDMPSSEKKLLCVNGKLTIHPGTEEVLKSFIRISVNGSVSYPENMSAFINWISVNGSMNSYPSDYKMLGKEFVVDRYFPIRAKEGGKYYAAKRIEITDAAVDMEVLVKKGVHFKTKELYVLEEKLKDCAELFDEEVRFQVIPTGFAFVKGFTILDQNMIRKYGKSFYIEGDLLLEKEAKEVLQYIENLYILGTLYLREEQMEELKQKEVRYEKVEIIKGDTIRGKAKVSLDSEMIAKCTEGVSLIECGIVQIEEEVSNSEILEKVCLINCGVVKCSRKQRAAVEMVGRGVGHIAGEEIENETNKEKEEPQEINADWYVL